MPKVNQEPDSVTVTLTHGEFLEFAMYSRPNFQAVKSVDAAFTDAGLEKDDYEYVSQESRPEGGVIILYKKAA